MNPCQQTESRIHHLLDQRQSWEADPQLTAHLRSCEACRKLSASYDALLVGCQLEQLSAEQSMPSIPADFAEKIALASAAPQTVAFSGRRSYRVLGGLAIAAVLLIAAWPIIRQNQTAVETPPPTQSVIALERLDSMGMLSSPFTTDSQFPSVWQVTGRNLATLPVTVREATQWPGEEGLVDSIRPMASSVGATVEALLRILPPTDQSPWEEYPAQLPNGDTGHYRPASPLTIV